MTAAVLVVIGTQNLALDVGGGVLLSALSFARKMAQGRWVVTSNTSCGSVCDRCSWRKVVDYVATSPLLRGLECHLVMVGLANAAHAAALQEASGRLTQAGYAIATQLLPGKAAGVIADQVKSTNIDLLVMGAYSRPQLREYFVGSSTTKLVLTCPASVLMFR